MQPIEAFYANLRAEGWRAVAEFEAGLQGTVAEFTAWCAQVLAVLDREHQLTMAAYARRRASRDALHAQRMAQIRGA